MTAESGTERRKEILKMDISTSKILSLAGLCRRAGGVIPGADAVISAIRRGGKGAPKAVVLSSSASDRTKKQITDKAESHGIPLLIIDADAYEIGERLGIISSCAVLALTGKGPADRIIKAAKDSGRDGLTTNIE